MRKKIFAIITALCVALCSIRLSSGLQMISGWASDGFVYEEDTWGFSQAEFLDGEKPYLQTVLQQKLLTGFTEDETARFKTAMAEPAEDISYGLSLLAMLCYEGIWEPSDVSNTAESLHDIAAPVRKDVFEGWINYYNLLQYTDDIVFMDELASMNDASASLQAAASAVKSGTALLRVKGTDSSAPVTMLIYGSENGSWSFDGTEYESRILAANPDNTEFSDEACLYYNADAGEWCIPQLKMSDASGAVLGAVIDDADLLNTYGYDPAKLPRMILEPVTVYPGQTDIPITMMQAGIPEAVGISLNIDLHPALEAVMSMSYSVESYDMGSALPVVACVSHYNEQQLICTTVMSASASSGIVCSDYEMYISFLMNLSDAAAVRDAAEEYGIELQNNEELGDHYVFPVYFNAEGMSSYYTDMYESNEFPILMNSEITVVMEERETTTASTATSTTKKTTTTSKTTTTTTASTTAKTTTTSKTTKASTTSSSSKTSGTVSDETTKATTTTTTSTTKKTAATTTTTTASTTTTTDTTTTTTTTTALTTTTTTTTASPTTTTTSATTKQSFEWGKDNWAMAYDMLGLQYLSEGYRLLEEHSDNLSDSLNPMERERIRTAEEREWLGAEYGMAVTEILAKSGVFSVSMWDPSAKHVNSLDLEDERNLSLISYYQLLQESDAVQQELAWTCTYMTQKSVLSSLISKAQNAGKGGAMTLAAFFSEGYAHAAVAYDAEYGSWIIGEETYDGRVLIADPYLDGFSDEACLYFSSSTLEWCVPMWNISSSEGCRIGLASDSLSMLNSGGYFMGTASHASSHPYIPIIEVSAGSGEFTLTPIGTDDDSSITGSGLKWFSAIASLVTHVKAGLDYTAEGYEICPLTEDTASYQMSFEESLITVRADKADKITMMAEGSAMLQGADSTYEIGITAETDLPWEHITISGTGCSVLLMEHTEDGLLLQGDCLEGTVITAESEYVSVSRKLEALSDGSSYTTALVYADSDDSICIMVDTDADGECETILQSEDIPAEDVRYGDVNLDGIVSMTDLVRLNYYLANCIMLNEEALLNADCDENMRLNAVDAQLVLRFLILDVPVLPLSKALEIMDSE